MSHIEFLTPSQLLWPTLPRRPHTGLPARSPGRAERLHRGWPARSAPGPG